MKKWSISLIVVSALGFAALALPTASSAASGQYCPGPYEPYKPCEEEHHEETTGGGGTTETPKTCASGQVGTYPNCVTPAIGVQGIKIKPNTSTLILKINAPGTVKIYGKGIKAKLVKVSPGTVKIKVRLTPKEKKLLKKKGKVSLKVKIVYTPTGGTPIKKTVKVTIKSKH
ncbi:MAG: hypothetical protein QM729_12305 [Solirubrobacterales bacterium]